MIEVLLSGARLNFMDGPAFEFCVAFTLNSIAVRDLGILNVYDFFSHHLHFVSDRLYIRARRRARHDAGQVEEILFDASPIADAPLDRGVEQFADVGLADRQSFLDRTEAPTLRRKASPPGRATAPLHRAAPEALLLNFVAHHLWDPVKRGEDPAHSIMGRRVRIAGHAPAQGYGTARTRRGATTANELVDRPVGVG